MTQDTALLVTAHGTVDHIDELAAFLQVIRRGRPAPPALLHEVQHRYGAIGGRSPLTEITEQQAQRTAALLGLRGAIGMRLWNPYIRPTLERLLSEGVRRIISLPAAPYSTHIYNGSVEQELAALGAKDRVEVHYVGAYHTHPALMDAFASRAREAGAGKSDVHVVFTAHSLPVVAIERGDPYAVLVGECVERVASVLGLAREQWTLSYQSQGASEGAWLGPTLLETFDALKARGVRDVVLSPVGFLTDHVEVLYDLDIEAKSWAEERGMRFARARAPNADEDLCAALAAVVRESLAK